MDIETFYRCQNKLYSMVDDFAEQAEEYPILCNHEWSDRPESYHPTYGDIVSMANYLISHLEWKMNRFHYSASCGGIDVEITDYQTGTSPMCRILYTPYQITKSI